MDVDAATRAAAQRARELESQGGGILLPIGLVLLLVSSVMTALMGAKGVGLGIVGCLLVLVGWLMAREGKRAEVLRLSGLRTQAHVLNAQTIQTQKDGTCRTRFELEVDLPGRERYRAESRLWANVVDAQRLAKCQTVWVRVDPADSSRILIEIESGQT